MIIESVPKSYFDVADENNAALRRMDALEKSLGRAEKRSTNAAEAKERVQKEVADREEQLAAVAAACEKEMANRLMIAAKAFSGEFPFTCFGSHVFSTASCLALIRVLFLFGSDASGITFD